MTIPKDIAIRSELQNYKLMTVNQQKTILECIEKYSAPIGLSNLVYRIKQAITLWPDWNLSTKLLAPINRSAANSALPAVNHVLSKARTDHLSYGWGDAILAALIDGDSR